MDHFIELRCPNKPKLGSDTECRGMCAGVSAESLRHFDFRAGPFVDMRYCGDCRGFFKITLRSLQGLPEIEIIPKDTKIPFIPSESYFGAENVTGRRLKNASH